MEHTHLYSFFSQRNQTVEAAPSNMRLKLDWCQDPSIDAWIHWLLRDAPPNGTGMRDCEIQDEELPPTLKLIKVLLASVSIQGFSSPRLQHYPTLLAGVKLRKLRMRMRTDVLQSLTLCRL